MITITRRKVLTGTLAAGLGATLLPSVRAADNDPLVVSAPGVFLPPDLRKAYEKATGRELKVVAWTTAPEMVTKTLAGDQPFDLLSLTEDWTRPLLPTLRLKPHSQLRLCARFLQEANTLRL